MEVTITEFKNQVKESGHKFSDPILQSLYHIKQDRWEASHIIAQDIHTKWGSLVHGLLHRIEGDRWNASYWYRQAGEEDFSGSIDEEWDYIAEKYLRTFIS